MEAIRSAFSVHTMGVLKGQFCLFGSQQEVDDHDCEVERLEQARKTARVEAAMASFLDEFAGYCGLVSDEAADRYRLNVEMMNRELLRNIAEDVERVFAKNGESAAWTYLYELLEMNCRQEQKDAFNKIKEGFIGWLEDESNLDDFEFAGLEYDDEMLSTVIYKFVYFSYEELKDDVLSYTTIEAA